MGCLKEQKHTIKPVLVIAYTKCRVNKTILQSVQSFRYCAGTRNHFWLPGVWTGSWFRLSDWKHLVVLFFRTKHGFMKNNYALTSYFCVVGDKGSGQVGPQQGRSDTVINTGATSVIIGHAMWTGNEFLSCQIWSSFFHVNHVNAIVQNWHKEAGLVTLRQMQVIICYWLCNE